MYKLKFNNCEYVIGKLTADVVFEHLGRIDSNLMMFEDGDFFFDRDGNLFRYLLTYFQNKVCGFTKDGLVGHLPTHSMKLLRQIREEAKLFGIEEVYEHCNNRIKRLMQLKRRNIPYKLVHCSYKHNCYLSRVGAGELCCIYLEPLDSRHANTQIDVNFYIAAAMGTFSVKVLHAVTKNVLVKQKCTSNGFRVNLDEDFYYKTSISKVVAQSNEWCRAICDVPVNVPLLISLIWSPWDDRQRGNMQAPLVVEVYQVESSCLIKSESILDFNKIQFKLADDPQMIWNFSTSNHLLTGKLLRATKHGNVLISPLGFQICLALLLLQSSQEQVEKIKHTLNLKSLEDLPFSTIYQYSANFVHTIFIKNGIPIENTFLEKSHSLYRCHVGNVDFLKEGDKMNEWIAQRSNSANVIPSECFNELTLSMSVLVHKFEFQWKIHPSEEKTCFVWKNFIADAFGIHVWKNVTFTSLTMNLADGSKCLFLQPEKDVDDLLDAITIAQRSFIMAIQNDQTQKQKMKMVKIPKFTNRKCKSELKKTFEHIVGISPVLKLQDEQEIPISFLVHECEVDLINPKGTQSTGAEILGHSEFIVKDSYLYFALNSENVVIQAACFR